MNIPADLLYSDEHVWVKKEGDQIRIGITEVAQDELGEVVFVELPDVGDDIEIDEPFGSVESVKTVSELYAPVSGTIIEVNEELEDNPEFVNESPYDRAWLVVVELTNEFELDNLLTDDEYANIAQDD